MADQQVPRHPEAADRQVVDCGGLRFEATFRAPAGATLRVFGEVDGDIAELLRFDDFIEDPHYHIPAAADPVPFDQGLRESLSPGSSPSYAIILLSYSTRRGSPGSSLTSTSMTSLSMQRRSERQWKRAYPTATYAYLASACGGPLPDHRVTAHRPLGLATLRRYRCCPARCGRVCFPGPLLVPIQ